MKNTQNNIFCLSLSNYQLKKQFWNKLSVFLPFYKNISKFFKIVQKKSIFSIQLGRNQQKNQQYKHYLPTYTINIQKIMNNVSDYPLYRTFFYILACVHIFMFLGNSQNIICNGNFSGFKTNGVYDRENFVYASSNYSCWYNLNGGQFEVKNKITPPMGYSAELVANSAYVLCQKVQLTSNTTYGLGFRLGTCKTMTYSTVKATINGVSVMNLTVNGQLKVAYGSKNFSWPVNEIVPLCFNSSFYIQNSKYNFLGPTINNISLVKMQIILNNSSNTTNSSTNPPNTISTNNSSNSSSSSNNLTNNSFNNFFNNSNNNSQYNSSSNQTIPPYNNTQNSSSIIENTTQNISTINQTQNSSIINDYFIQQNNQTILNTTEESIFIYCKTEKTDIYDQMIITCNYTDQGFYFYLKNIWPQIQLYVEGELQTQFHIFDILPNSMKINFFPRRSYLIKNVSIFLQGVKDINVFAQVVKFKFFINDCPATFVILSKEETNLIKQMEPFTQQLMSYTFKIYLSLKSCFLSYFLTDLISFWNLSLMYNLLRISTTPLFLKYFFENLSFQFFNLNSIIDWMGTKIPNLQQNLDFSSTLGSQKMDDYKNSFAWFGSFGMSSGFLSNNTQNILVIGILIIKLVTINYVRNLLCCSYTIFRRKLYCYIPHGIQLRIIFVEEFFLITIFMVVSAVTTLMDVGFYIWKEKINFILQCIILWIVLMLYPLFVIMKFFSMKMKFSKKMRQNYEKNKNELKTQEQKSNFFQEKMKKLKNKKSEKILLQSTHNMFEYLLYTCIPALVVIGHTFAFLLIMSIIIGIRIWWYIKNRAKLGHKKVWERIFTVLNLTVWLIHHCVYLIYFILQKILENSNYFNQNEEIMFGILKYCGLISIFNVLTGGFCEILSSFFTIIHRMIRLIKFLFKKIRNKRFENKQKIDKSEKSQKSKLKKKQGNKLSLVPIQPMACKQNKKNEKKQRIRVRIKAEMQKIEVQELEDQQKKIEKNRKNQCQSEKIKKDRENIVVLRVKLKRNQL